MRRLLHLAPRQYRGGRVIVGAHLEVRAVIEAVVPAGFVETAIQILARLTPEQPVNIGGYWTMSAWQGCILLEYAPPRGVTLNEVRGLARDARSAGVNTSVCYLEWREEK